MFLWAVRVSLYGSAVSAVILGRRRADHRAFAAFLLLMAAKSIARAFLAAPVRSLDAPPFTGAARLSFHLEEALFLAWPAGVAAVALWYFAGPRWSAVPALIWALVVGYLATHYPAVRGEALRDVYAAAELAAVLASAGAITRWTWRRLSPTPAHVCVLLVVLVDGGATLAGSLRWGLWAFWYLDQIAALFMFSALVGYQVWTLGMFSQSR